jgi:phage terminase large subunit-like protein
MAIDITRLEQYRTDPAAFIDDFLPLNEKGKPWRLSAHQRKVLRLAFRWTAEGRLDLLRLLIWGEMKKSGKTALAAALGLWWGFTRSWTEIVVIANDLEQSIGRVFKTMVQLLTHNGLLEWAEVRAKSISISNGTLIEAIPSDYAGEAGRRHSLAIFDEPWGITSERAMRLYEELTPPPTEDEAFVLMTTYAGFTGESVLLERLYQDALTGERLDDDLEVYRKDAVTMFWSHTPRMPWQTESYYAQQRQTLRPNAYLRLHENRWVSGTESFITAEAWDACVDDSLSPQLGPFEQPTVIAVDASFKHDESAAVAVQIIGGKVVLVAHRIWKPTPAEPLDLELTIEAWLLEAHARGRVEAIVVDPYQMHRSITTLQRRGLPIRELPQTVGNVTGFGQALFDAIQGKNLRMYPDPALRAQALNAVAVEGSRGWKIAKERTNKKIDAIVALAMATHTAISGASVGGQFGTGVYHAWM